MPEARPVALIGDLLVTQLKTRGAIAVLTDSSVRDVETLREMGLPIWTRWVRAHGAGKETRGQVNGEVVIGGASMRTGDVIVMDDDGATVLPGNDAELAVELGLARELKENNLRDRWRGGELSYDVYGFRSQDEGEPQWTSQ
jgi:4-hydroxy-4-methyl-2-oxoglutarate aldolase